jgi:hypothetical protein
MKPAFILQAFLLLMLNVSAQHKKISVLFIGNSYTSVNNLPLLVDSIVTAGGDTMDWDVNAPGGYTLQLHSVDVTTLSKINSRAWDYVVLQEQSQLPSFHPDSVDSTTTPYALILSNAIRANDSCTQIVFYETWGRKYGDASNCATYPPVCTYSGMQQRLMESYKMLADTCHSIVAPVGEAFRYSIGWDSTVNLYQADESHPSLEGSFLAASVFYNIFFHKSANGNTYDPGVTQLPAYMFHLFAHQVVVDTLNFWNVGIYEPWAQFTWHEAPGCVGVFNGMSNSNFSHLWDFGDSTTSTDANPVHQYPYSRYFPVRHIVYNSCSSDTFRLTNNMICNGGVSVNEISENNFIVFPNPAQNQLAIGNWQLAQSSPSFGGFAIKSVVVLNLIGVPQLCEMDLSISNNQHQASVDVSGLSGGIYFLRITDDEEHFSTLKFTIIR